ncbi:fumarylacetoacetate hydrolase family protein [Mycolicibacterium vaccae]|nr:fumarylacetoacetate hydrolase family protein [Mycolicibacterium vaccae]
MADAVWALAQYRTARGVATGILADGALLAAPRTLADRTVMELLHEWDHWSEALRTIDLGALTPVDGDLVAAADYPGKVICAGANYYDHADEMGVDRPDASADPFFFLKAPTTTIIGPSATVAVFDDARSQVDWEAELAVVIGNRCRDVDIADAVDVIAGYAVANDISDRGSFHRSNAVAAPFEWDWLAHKSQDGFCPLGPGLVPAWLVPDPQSLKIRLDVNGHVKQDSTTAQMVVSVNGLVAAASRVMTLEPGDVLLTGTPAGVGMPRNDFLRPDDVITVEIEGVGRISNKVVAK